MEFKSNAPIFIKGIKDLKDNAIDTKPLMKKIAADMKTKVDMRFKQTKDPNGIPWAPLSDTTVSRRRGGSSKPLNDEGGLALSMNYKYTEDSAIAGTNKKYAAFQNFPAKKGEFKKKEKETVKAHTRRSHTRRTKTGVQQIEETNIRQHERENQGSPWGDKPGREFIGFSENQKRMYKKWISDYFKGVNS